MLRTRETLHSLHLPFLAHEDAGGHPIRASRDGDESDRCAVELDDAAVDVFGYACLVAIMARGHAYHRVSQERIERVTSDAGCSSPVITSAGALVSALNAIGAKRVALIAPYIRPLTEQVVSYIESEGTQVNDFLALETAHNLDVGARDPMALNQIVDRLGHSSAYAVILSACVQMPSLAAIQIVQDHIGKPVVSSAVATTYHILKALGPVLPGAD
jgi:maleate isomerase